MPRSPLSVSLPSVGARLAPVLLALFVLAPGCKKEEAPITPEPATTETDAENDDKGPEYPAQDPDPAELAQALERYLLGHNNEAADLVRPLSDSLLGDPQIRARGIAASLLALANARDLGELAQGPAAVAAEQAARLPLDAELGQLAELAQASYLIGVNDETAAEAHVRAALSREGPHGALAELLLAQAVLGQAFEDDKLLHGDKLDAAAALYERVWNSEHPEILRARAADGLAAIAYYKKNKEDTCKWAAEASGLYERLGASDYLKEGPRGPAESMRCP